MARKMVTTGRSCSECENVECESRAEHSAGDDQRVKETVKKPIQAVQGESQSRPRRLAAQ